MGDVKRIEAVTRLREHEAELKRLGVQLLFLFGSTARDGAQPDSDVDLYFDYPRGQRWQASETCYDTNMKT